MIQSTNSHVRRLLSEKAQYEDELQKAKEIMKGRMQGILLQCKFTFSIYLICGSVSRSVSSNKLVHHCSSFN